MRSDHSPPKVPWHPRWRLPGAALATSILALICAGAGAVAAFGFEGAVASEEEVRAAFLFQLAQYVDWPADALGRPNAPLRFCVLGQDKLLSTLEPTVRGKTIRGRPITLQKADNPAQLEGCHVAFLALRGERQIRGALREWRYPPVLLVGEAEGFAEYGGMVNLVIASGHVSFEINIGAAERARLDLRSQLLRFAHIVVARTGDRQ